MLHQTAFEDPQMFKSFVKGRGQALSLDTQDGGPKERSAPSPSPFPDREQLPTPMQSITNFPSHRGVNRLRKVKHSISRN